MPDFETGREAALAVSSARAAVPSKAEARMAAAIAAVWCFFMVVLLGRDPGRARRAAQRSGWGGTVKNLTPHRERLPPRRRPLPGTRRKSRAPRAPLSTARSVAPPEPASPPATSAVLGRPWRRGAGTAQPLAACR